MAISCKQHIGRAPNQAPEHENIAVTYRSFGVGPDAVLSEAALAIPAQPQLLLAALV